MEFRHAVNGYGNFRPRSLRIRKIRVEQQWQEHLWGVWKQRLEANVLSCNMCKFARRFFFFLGRQPLSRLHDLHSSGSFTGGLLFFQGLSWWFNCRAWASKTCKKKMNVLELKSFQNIGTTSTLSIFGQFRTLCQFSPSLGPNLTFFIFLLLYFW